MVLRQPFNPAGQGGCLQTRGIDKRFGGQARAVICYYFDSILCIFYEG